MSSVVSRGRKFGYLLLISSMEFTTNSELPTGVPKTLMPSKLMLSSVMYVWSVMYVHSRVLSSVSSVDLS